MAALRLLCLVVLLTAGVYAGQLATGELGGAVRDESGGGIPGAAVMLTPDGGAPLTTVTDARGVYVFEGVPAGRYQLTITLDGFAPIVRRVVATGERQQLPVATLRVAIDERVEVVGSLDEFRRVTGLSPVGLTLASEQLDVLPNDPDMMLQVLRELSATTGRADEVTIFVDGQPVTSRLPPKAAIQSIRISTNAFAPEFAEPSAGLVEIVTKPASTSFRGESMATFNDSLLNARNFFEPVRRPSRTQGYTGYLGGPVVPGRWSFLAYGGRWQRDERLVVNTTVVDPQSLAPTPYVESVVTPSRVDSYSLRTDVIAASRHLFAVEYGRTSETYRNVGLESGLDLPERGINRGVVDETARMAAVSTFGPFVSNEFRVRLRRRTLDEAAISTAPAVLILDAYNTGGNQAALGQHRATREATVTEILSYADDLQSIRGGVQVDLLRVDELRRVNEGGTFVFGALADPAGRVLATPFERYLRTLRGEPGYNPSYFSIARGAPDIAFNDWQVAWFIQDDVKHTDNVTLSAGIRHGLQKHGHHVWQDIAPRAGIGWTPGGSPNHVLRVASGLFYSRLPPELTLDTLRYDSRFVELVVDRPTFFSTIPGELTGTAARPTTRLKDRLRAPLTAAAAASYDWQLGKALFSSVGYTYTRGYRLLRTRNVNARDLTTGAVPYPEQGPMLRFESTGRSTTQEFRATVRRALTRVSIFGTYLLRFSKSNTDGPYTVLADAIGDSDFGRAADDERHRVVVGSWIGLPREISISTFLTVGSGRPFNITTGIDDDGDLLFFDRPALAASGTPGAIETAFGDFALHRNGAPMIPRNFGQGPRQVLFNVGIAKTFRFGAGATGGPSPYAILGLTAENVTNYVNFSDFNGVVTSSQFGVANRALTPRRIELTARVGF